MSDSFDDSDEEALIFAATQAESIFGTQGDFQDSPRATKRRRLQAIEEDSDDEDAFDPVPFNKRAEATRLVRNNAAQLNGSSSQPSEVPGMVDTFIDDDLEGDDIVETLDQQLEREAAERAADPARFSKYKLHVPKHQPQLEDRYYTQLPTDAIISTQPHHIRGAIWQKKPPLVQHGPTEAEDDSGIGLDDHEETRQSILGAAVETAKDDLGNFHPDLEGIPSDAFDSSSPAIARPRLAAPVNNLRQTTLFGREGADAPRSQANMRYNWPMAGKDEPPTHHKLDKEAMETWVYPTNLGTTRDYQFNIVARGLFHNTLVALPTGLGKTFIAATIMLNWFRWSIDAQIVFVAPTKPLVAQQVDACFGIAGIPRSQTTMLTGEVSPALREEEWQSKRVFFMTPQTFINDLKVGICDPKKIVLIVFDEAHRATGAYAYVEVVKFIRRFNESFRILALTATPGSDVEGVQQVIDGLDISRVEIRTEQSLDIRQYVHTRKIEKQVFDNSEEMVMLMELFTNAVKPVLTILNTQNAYWQKDPCDLTPFGLTKARQSWMGSEAGRNANAGLKNMVLFIFSMLASLAHSMSLLKYHGIMPFYQALLAFKNEGKGKSKYRQMILESKDFALMLQRLRAFSVDPDFLGHPKLAALREVVLNHFMDNGETTRVMIFAHFRDAAEDIVKTLERDQPMIKPHVFNGQAGTKNSEGMSQKKQIEVVQNFKAGKFNTLVATSIGEEGLDIGEVDLIICYDSKASPIRMLQRMGRTGRKRQGKIVLFQMRGKEEQDAEKAKDSYEKMQEMIADGGRFNFHDDRSRRIVPKVINPQVDKRIIEIPLENSQAGLPTPQRKARGKKAKRPAKKFHMPDGVRTGFTNASRMDDDEDEGGGIDEFFIRRSKSPVKKRSAEVEEGIPVPSLEEVYLNDEEQTKWECQYAQVNDEEDLTVWAPRLDAYPERQRNASRTKLVSHKTRTLMVCEKIRRPTDLNGEYPTLSQMTEPPNIIIEDECTPSPQKAAAKEQKAKAVQKPRGRPTKKLQSRPKAQDRARHVREASGEALEADESSPPPISPGMALPSQGIWIGTADTDGEDDDELPDSELADFVVDDEAPVEVADDSSLPNLSQLQTQARQRKQAQSLLADEETGEDSEDEDLPDVLELNRGFTAAKRKEVVRAPIARPPKKRRVVDDSSEDD